MKLEDEFLEIAEIWATIMSENIINLIYFCILDILFK